MASQEFKASIKARERQIKAYVELEYEELVDKTNLTVAEGTQAEISIVSQILDETSEVINYASFERNYFKTDGSMILPNDPVLTQNLKTGFIAENTNESYVEIDTTGNRTYEAITILFNNGYAKSGNILFVGSTLKTQNFVNENNAECLIVELNEDMKSISPTIITIDISEWSNQEHRPRISRIELSVFGVYKDKELIEININEEVDVTNQSTPTSDSSVILNNYDLKFDMFNNNGLYKYIKSNMEIHPYIGCVLDSGLIEYQKMGKYYLTDFNNNKDKTTTFNMQNFMKFLDVKSGYRGSARIDTYFANVLSNSNILNFKNLTNSNFVVYDTYLKDCTVLEQLQYIALFSNTKIYVDRDGDVCIADLDTVPVDSYNLSNFSSLPEIKINNKIKKIIISRNSIATLEIDRETVFQETIKHNSSGTTEVYLSFDEPISWGDTSTAFTVSAGTITNIYFNMYTAQIRVSATSDFVLTAKAAKVTLSTTTQEFFDTTVENGDTLEISVIGLYSNLSQIATNIFNNINKNYVISTEGQQDPSILAGQMISVETRNGYKNMIVNKNSYKFVGSLTGNLEGVGN